MRVFTIVLVQVSVSIAQASLVLSSHVYSRVFLVLVFSVLYQSYHYIFLGITVKICYCPSVKPKALRATGDTGRKKE